MDEHIQKHPSFGLIGFSRVNSNGQRFFGSELQQNNYISMEIHQASKVESLTNERYYAEEQILRIRMTSNQFAEMITSMNHGSGVPCTIERIQQKTTPPLPELESRKEYVHNSFRERMEQFANRIKENQQIARNLVSKKTLTKEDQRQLLFEIDYMSQEITNNIPFFAQCFQESMDDMVLEAKTEVENAIQHKITSLGLTELHNQNQLLIQSKKESNDE